MEYQLKLLSPQLFEELCAQVIKEQYPQSWHVDGSGGDEGIDIFAGELDNKKRKHNRQELSVWQVKYFLEIKHGQIKKIKDSLERVVKKHQPEHWILCLPINLNIHQRKWFEEIKNDYSDVEIDLWQADTVIAKMPEKLIDSYFLKHQAIPDKKFEAVIERLNDFQSVSQLLEQNRAIKIDAHDFYNGTIPTWADITHNFDAPREAFGRLWQFIAGNAGQTAGRIPFGLITGRSGDGKSTLLMRLAAELTNISKAVFICKGDIEHLNVDQLCAMPRDQLVYVLIDKIGKYDNLTGFFERLYREHVPVVVIGAETQSLWEGRKITLEDCCDFFELPLNQLTSYDIEGLLDKLSEKPEYLGALASLSRGEQLEIFRQKAGRQLLVALLEAKYNQPLKAHIKKELHELVPFLKS